MTVRIMFLVWLILGCGLIILVEWLMWRLFCKKAVGLILPHEVDTSALRFFTFNRMRILAFAHTGAMIGVFIISYITVW